MAKQEVKIGQTNYTALVKIRDTAGAAKTGLDEGDIDIAYARVETDNDVTTNDVTPVALATPALTDPHLDWGFLEVSATDHPGLYRLDIADEVFASGAWSSVVTITGTGLDPTDLEFVLVPDAPVDGVRLTAAAITALLASTVASPGGPMSNPPTLGQLLYFAGALRAGGGRITVDKSVTPWVVTYYDVNGDVVGSTNVTFPSANELNIAEGA